MGWLDDFHSLATSVLRYGRGYIVRPIARRSPPRPAHALELFDQAACPYCRKVREVLSELDLVYIQRSSPRGARTGGRPFVRDKGKQQFPFLVDANAGVEMYESEDIITHLLETYGRGRSWVGRPVSPLNTASSVVASAVRPIGSTVREGSEERAAPTELLELWSFEASPYCRKVREVLCSLNLDCRVHNVAKLSTRRPELVALGGKMQVPYLVDRNTGVAMYESDEINRYLLATYG
jgi:glutathione S-transferase